MATTRDIINRAFRLMGVTAAGKVVDGTDARDALERLQSVITGLPGFVFNARWREKSVAADYTAKEGQRITLTAAAVITLPTTISDAGCSRPPHDLARIQILGDASNAGLWVYSATNGAWRQADALALTSNSPFGPEDDAGLAALLAVEQASEYSGEQELGAATIVLANRATASFRARFKKFETCCLAPLDYPPVGYDL